MEAVISKAKNYLGLVRFSHTLFALPFALSSMLLAAEGLPNWKTILLILLAMVTARNCAMAFNRLVDIEFDAQNPRTKNRHLPTGVLKRKQVSIFMGINIFFFIGTCYLINNLAFYLSPVALFIILAYSLTKRFTRFCHFVLGLALAISPVGAWIAVTGQFAVAPVLMGLAILLWVSGFDMVYSILDLEFDKRVGLYSMPSGLGVKKTLYLTLACHLAMVLVLYSIEIFINAGPVYFVGVSAIGAMVLLEHLQAREGSAENINKAFFQANAIISLIYLTTIVLDTFWI